MGKLKETISNRLRKFQFESQTVPLQNAPAYIKIMAFVYQLIGRKLLAKSLVSSSECDACNICVKVCPNQAIKLNRNNPHRNNKCKGCLLCVYSCPKRVFYLPAISLIGAVLLLFLPYDNWIIKISSLKIVPEMGYLKYIFPIIIPTNFKG
jgi:ferredoxin